MWILLVIAVAIQLLVVQTQEDQINFVYESRVLKVYDVSSINGSCQNIKVAAQANVIVGAVGKAGIIVIDKQLNSQTFIQPEQQYIETVQVTADARYILSPLKDRVVVYELIDFQKLNLISTIETSDISVSDLQLDKEEDVLFIVGYLGVLRWYDFRDKTKIIQVGELVYDQMLFVKGQISPDGVFFYIAADQDGLLAFHLQKQYGVGEVLQIDLRRVLRKQAVSSFIEVVVVSSNKYAFTIDRWNGVYTFYTLSNLITTGDDPESINNDAIIMMKTNLGNNAGYTSTLSLSSNSQFLYVGVRSQGILIYNIADPLNPQFFQQLQLSGQSVSLKLSGKLNPNEDEENIFDNQYIFYSNSISIVVYQKNIPSLYKSTPNLFNFQNSQLFIDGTASTKWRCYISQNSQYMFGAFDADSLIIYKLDLPKYSDPQSVQMKLIYQFDETDEILKPTDKLRVFGPNDDIPYSFYIDTVQFSKDERFMYFASSQYDLNIVAYKFEIIKNELDPYWSFKFVKALKHSEVYYIEQINISDDELHAVMSFDVGIILVDMVNFEILSQYNNVGVLGTCCGAVLSHDKKYALAVTRNIGLFVYDTSDMTKPFLVNSWRTNGGETLYRSKTDSIIYLVDGFNGIILLDSTKFPNIVVISKFVVAGWSNYISFTLTENYGIISTMDTGMLTLIDLHDKGNPRLIMKSSIKGQDSQTTCLDSSGITFGFSPNKHGVRYFQMQSVVSLHVERELKATLTQESIKLQDGESFEVGNTYIVRFTSLYRKDNQIISNIYHYENLILTDLPSWIKIDRINSSDPNLQTAIQIDIPKESLESKDSKSSFLIIVVKTCFQLSEESFIFHTNSIESSKDESLLIYKYLKSTGYINASDCVTDFFSPQTTSKTISIGDAFRDIPIDSNKLMYLSEYVNETLKKSTVYNQFIFDVISSLKFNQDNKNQMITANQDYVSVHLSFPINFSPFVFVQKVYPDIIIYLNDDKTIMKIEGSRIDVNKALSGQILYFDLTKKEDSSEKNLSGEKALSIQIMDNFNYDLSYKLKVPSEVKFLREKKDIQISLHLQDQVNKQYQDASLFIEVAFLIEFSKKSFIDPDDIELTYELQEEINGKFVTITSDSFIKFDNNNLRLVGTPTSADLFTTVSVRLVATNGYTKSQQEFTIKINKMPFSYIFNKLIQILGPIAFVFGLYRKRSTFMNVYFKKNTMYSTEVAYVNQMYRKKITILGYDYEIAHLFFLKFIKSNLKNITSNNQITLYQPQGTTPRDRQYSEQSLQNKQTLNNQFELFSPNNTNRNLISNVNSQQSFQILKGTKQEKNENQQNNIEGDNLANKNQQQLEIKSEDFINKLFKKDKQEDLNENSKMQKNTLKQQGLYEFDIKFLHKKILEKNLETLTSQDKKDHQLIKRLVIKDDFSIDITNFVNEMLKNNLQITFNLQNYQLFNYKIDAENTSSRFYNCLKAVIIRYLIDNDDNIQYLYKLLKKYSLQQSNFSQNDWYKFYVNIIATQDTDKFGIPVPFSNAILKEDVFYDIFKILKLIPADFEKSKFSYTSSLLEHQINPYLLKEILFADALGLQLVSAKSILKCNGQSLHLENHSIISIEAYKLVEEGLCLCLRKPFNLNYQTLPISKHLSLPSWLGYDCKNGVIILEGIPSKQDINHILIRIYDSIHFATFQFHLKIEDNTDYNSSDQQENIEDIRLSPPKFQKNYEDLILQKSLSYHKLQQSLNPSKSIFNINKFEQELKKQNTKQSHITEKFSGEKSSESQNGSDEENKYLDNDEIQEENKAIQMNELDTGVCSPPLFPHNQGFQDCQITLKQNQQKQNIQFQEYILDSPLQSQLNIMPKSE